MLGRPGGRRGWVLGGRAAVLGGQRGAGYRWASAIDLIYRIKMVVARASGTLIASSLEQNKFWTLELRPAGGGPPGPGGPGGMVFIFGFQDLEILKS